MLLAIDCGNTNTVFGLFDGKRLKKTWRVESKRSAILRQAKKIPRTVDAAIISSVVPALNDTLKRLAKKVSGRTPLFVHAGLRMPIRIRTKNPREVGADRIVNAVAAYSKWRRTLLIVDFGTATTFDVVTRKGEYVGGAIAPGIEIATEALAEKCAKLPKIKLARPGRAIGGDTVSAMQSGVFLGYVSLVEGMIQRIAREMKSKPLVIATGGLATVIAKECHSIKKVEPHLTLEGLRILYEQNRG